MLSEEFAFKTGWNSIYLSQRRLVNIQYCSALSLKPSQDEPANDDHAQSLWFPFLYYFFTFSLLLFSTFTFSLYFHFHFFSFTFTVVMMLVNTLNCSSSFKLSQDELAIMMIMHSGHSPLQIISFPFKVAHFESLVEDQKNMDM